MSHHSLLSNGGGNLTKRIESILAGVVSSPTASTNLTKRIESHKEGIPVSRKMTANLTKRIERPIRQGIGIIE